MRWALGVEYDGTAFAGFQRQAHHDAPTVQGSLEAALSSIADHPLQLVCAGRTDAGVHACAQVVHFDCDAPRGEQAWRSGGNSLTPDGISVLWARPVADDFHARFSARWRRYLYLLRQPGPPSALLDGRVTNWRRPIDADRMRAAADALLGEQDFTSFRAAGCQARHGIREVLSVAVLEQGPFVGFEIRANAFVQHMVRNIVGSLLAVGTGAREPEWIGQLIAERDRTRAAATAPPQGLYLTGVGYDPEHDLPSAERAPGLPYGLLQGGIETRGDGS